MGKRGIFHGSHNEWLSQWFSIKLSQRILPWPWPSPTDGLQDPGEEAAFDRGGPTTRPYGRNGKRLPKNDGLNHHAINCYEWENPLFLWNITMLLMGQSTISMAIFSYVNVYQSCFSQASCPSTSPSILHVDMRRSRSAVGLRT